MAPKVIKTAPKQIQRGAVRSRCFTVTGPMVRSSAVKTPLTLVSGGSEVHLYGQRAAKTSVQAQATLDSHPGLVVSNQPL